MRDALEYGPTPWRSEEGSGVPDMIVPGDETLNVNVFTPRPGDTEANLPVLVWIHGGGYFGGTSADPWYDGRSYNRDGVITVSISYRLGMEGFGWIEEAPANRGVLDWIAALEWVQENIRAFGGDPTRVTISGQSAGGGAVLTLLGMERAQHLHAQNPGHRRRGPTPASRPRHHHRGHLPPARRSHRRQGGGPIALTDHQGDQLTAHREISCPRAGR